MSVTTIGRAKQTKYDFCCQKVGHGKKRRNCKNPPVKDVTIAQAHLGSYCEIHLRLLLEAVA